MDDVPTFDVGDRVYKIGGDYSFEGVVVSAFDKTTGFRRYVVENPQGLLHIFSGRQLGRIEADAGGTADAH